MAVRGNEFGNIITLTMKNINVNYNSQKDFTTLEAWKKAWGLKIILYLL